MAKYLKLLQTYTFILIAMQTLGPINSDGLQFQNN